MDFLLILTFAFTCPISKTLCLNVESAEFDMFFYTKQKVQLGFEPTNTDTGGKCDVTNKPPWCPEIINTEAHFRTVNAFGTEKITFTGTKTYVVILKNEASQTMLSSVKFNCEKGKPFSQEVNAGFGIKGGQPPCLDVQKVNDDITCKFVDPERTTVKFAGICNTKIIFTFSDTKRKAKAFVLKVEVTPVAIEVETTKTTETSASTSTTAKTLSTALRETETTVSDNTKTTAFDAKETTASDLQIWTGQPSSSGIDKESTTTSNSMNFKIQTILVVTFILLVFNFQQ